ncbi:hypothetical protein BDR05DRAFT_951066 [Suillus weaverae]|nr:hypothetical protein BDR05DRAFT_951066 [Suillus weaverae]
MAYCITTAKCESWQHFNGDKYVEATIFQCLRGVYRGEYVAECATGSCSYMVNVEKYYGRTYVPAVYYPRRWFSIVIYVVPSRIYMLEMGKKEKPAAPKIP